MFRAIGLSILAAIAASGLARAGSPPRVLSLDQCADQYVLALSPRSAIVGLSPRALNADSLLRARASGLPVRRADREVALSVRPQIVVRYWGGDPSLLADLRRGDARVVQIEDAVEFDGIRRNVRVVAAPMGRGAPGEALFRIKDAKLAASQGAWGGRGAIYLTAGGATAGGGTLVDAILRAAGLRNLTVGRGYRSVSLERLALEPPQAVIRGFFDPASQSEGHWGAGASGMLGRLTAKQTLVSLPGALLGCPAWFAADAVVMIADAAPAGGAFGRQGAPVGR